MAVSQNLNQFAKRLVIRGNQLVKSIERIVRKAALTADQVAVLATLVDTGRARGNWLPSIGSPQKGGGSLDKNGAPTINKARQVVKGYKIGGNGIFITNNVPYILILENGTATRAPNNMAKKGIQAAVVSVRGDKLFKR